MNLGLFYDNEEEKSVSEKIQSVLQSDFLFLSVSLCPCLTDSDISKALQETEKFSFGIFFSLDQSEEKGLLKIAESLSEKGKMVFILYDKKSGRKIKINATEGTVFYIGIEKEKISSEYIRKIITLMMEKTGIDEKEDFSLSFSGLLGGFLKLGAAALITDFIMEELEIEKPKKKKHGGKKQENVWNLR